MLIVKMLAGKNQIMGGISPPGYCFKEPQGRSHWTEGQGDGQNPGARWGLEILRLKDCDQTRSFPYGTDCAQIDQKPALFLKEIYHWLFLIEGNTQAPNLCQQEVSF